MDKKELLFLKKYCIVNIFLRNEGKTTSEILAKN